MRDPTGMFVHILSDDGFADMQGQVLRIDGDSVEVQLYEVLLGTASDVRNYGKNFILSSKCRLYQDAQSWRASFDRDQRARGFI